MKATKITDDEIKDMKISSLPTRPTAPTAFGGKGYTSTEMRAAFDKLPLFLVERFNALIDDITAEGEDSITHAIPTVFGSNYSLADMINDIYLGGILDRIEINGNSLAYFLNFLRRDVDKLLEKCGLESVAKNGG